MQKAVFDTNVFISGIFFRGYPRKCIQLAVEGNILLYISQEILEELSNVLVRKKFGVEPFRVKSIVNEIESIASLVRPLDRVITACRDQKDHIILECALHSNSGIIVTGDADLLSLHEFRGIQIVTCRDFIEGI